MFRIVSALKKKGLLAINKRNADYTLKYNPRRLYPLVDDKLRTKQIAHANNIAVPDLYAVIEVAGQVHALPETLKEYSDFVIKPAHGSGGEGILVIADRLNGKLRKHDGTIITWEDLYPYIFNVLSGLYSLGGQPDQALVEYRVKSAPVFEGISYQGVPDVRIILLLGVPVMSMVRLPTRKSEGKANLHQGAIGVGIDIATGTTLGAVQGNEMVTDHPDTGQPVSGLTIPHWDDLLKLASRCFDLTGLGYQGVDIVLDRDRGPLILELNARPGLNIQLANNAGLLLRLELVERRHSELPTVEQRVAFAKDHFGAINPTPYVGQEI